jgi:TatD DNase family protein
MSSYAPVLADAHCHLADRRFDECRADVMRRARARGIRFFIQGGVDPDDWRRQCELTEPGIAPCFGLHPWYIDRAPTNELSFALDQLAQYLPSAAGLGELGLDLGPQMNPERFSLQRELFARQLRLNLEFDKPLVLHLVQCHGEAPQLLRSVSSQWRGLVHSFSGSLESAQAYIALGLLISISGSVTLPGYSKLKSAIKDIPAEFLVVESDAPDRAPDTYRRPLNEPESLFVVAEAVAQLRGESVELVLQRSTANLHRTFDLESYA